MAQAHGERAIALAPRDTRPHPQWRGHGWPRRRRDRKTSTRRLSDAAIHDLRASLRGALLQPGDAHCDAARTIDNATIDRRPAVIARCAGVADVMAAVRFARQHDVLVSVRAGGHNVAGSRRSRRQRT